MTCKPDGEDTTIAVLSEDGLLPTQKVYSFTKKSTHTGILVALFWPKNQILEQFVHGLPSEALFVEPGPTVEHFKDDFEKHKVPRRKLGASGHNVPEDREVGVARCGTRRLFDLSMGGPRRTW